MDVGTLAYCFSAKNIVNKFAEKAFEPSHGNAVWKVLPLAGTWGLWTLKKTHTHTQKWIILQPSLLRTIMKAVSLCCGAQTEFRRALSKTGMLIIAT